MVNCYTLSKRSSNGDLDLSCAGRGPQYSRFPESKLTYVTFHLKIWKMDLLVIGNFQVRKVDRENFSDSNHLRHVAGLPLKSWEEFESGKVNSWIIQLPAVPALNLGVINIVPFRPNEWEIGFFLIPSQRGLGVLTTILGPFVAALKLPLFAETSEENIPAQKVLEKAGFTSCPPVHNTHLDPYGIEHITVAFRFAPTK